MFLYKEKTSPFYQLVYLSDGKRKKVSTKCKMKTEALSFLSNFKLRLKHDNNSKIVSLEDFKDEYIDYTKTVRSKSYIKSIELSFKIFNNFLGNFELRKIDQRIAEKFILSVYDKSKFAAGLYYRSLKAAFGKAVEWNYISENPFTKFKFPKLPRSLPLFINYDELLLIVENTKKPVLKDIFFTGFFTGLRLGEILNLRWNMIDFTRQIITLKHNKSFTTKSKKERIIPINKPLFELLKNRYPKIISIDKSDLVFYNVKNIVLNTEYVSKSFKKSVRAAELNDKIHFHTLRHSFASNLIQKGVSLYVVKELLGHESITTTQIYSHIRNDNLFDAVKCLEPELTENKKSKEHQKSKGL